MKVAKIALALDPENSDGTPVEKDFIKIPYRGKDGTWMHMYAANSCYHVMHKAEFDAIQF